MLLWNLSSTPLIDALELAARVPRAWPLPFSPRMIKLNLERKLHQPNIVEVLYLTLFKVDKCPQGSQAGGA